MRNPPLEVPFGGEGWEWVITNEGGVKHRLSRVVTRPGDARGDAVLSDWQTTKIVGVTVCGYDGELRGGGLDLEDVPECAACRELLGGAEG